MGIFIPNCLDDCLAINRDREYRNRICSDFIERRRLKLGANPVASPELRFCKDNNPFASQRLHRAEPRWRDGDFAEEHDLDRFDYIILAAVTDKEVSSLINASSKACILSEKSLYDCAS